MATKPNKDLFPKLMTEASADKMKALATQLGSDAAVRKKFLDNPGAALKGLGITVDPNVKLDARQRAMIELFADPKLAQYYNSGDINSLRLHVAETYKNLLGSEIGSIAGFAVADFDVAIEVEAVAVAVVAVAAVAVGAVQPAERLREFEMQAGLMNAKIAALEARVTVMDRLEAKLTALEKRVR